VSQPTCDDGAYTWQNVWTWKDGASRGAHLALAEVRGERHDLAAVRVLEFKGVRWSRKASRAGIETVVRAERHAGKSPSGIAFTSRTRSYGDQCDDQNAPGATSG
jgi:hypothetical protein